MQRCLTLRSFYTLGGPFAALRLVYTEVYRKRHTLIYCRVPRLVQSYAFKGLKP